MGKALNILVIGLIIIVWSAAFITLATTGRTPDHFSLGCIILVAILTAIGWLIDAIWGEL